MLLNTNTNTTNLGSISFPRIKGEREVCALWKASACGNTAIGQVPELERAVKGGVMEKVDTSMIVRVKKTVWRDEHGWRLVKRGEGTWAVHHCSRIVLMGGEWTTTFGGDAPIVQVQDRSTFRSHWYMETSQLGSPMNSRAAGRRKRSNIKHLLNPIASCRNIPMCNNGNSWWKNL